MLVKHSHGGDGSVCVLLCFLLLWGAQQDAWQCWAAVTREVMQVSPTTPRVALLGIPCPSGTENELGLQVKVKGMARVGMQ